MLQRMISHGVSRDGSNRASENEAHAEWMIQQRASRDEENRSFENEADAEHSFSSCIYQHCGHTHN